MPDRSPAGVRLVQTDLEGDRTVVETANRSVGGVVVGALSQSLDALAERTIASSPRCAVPADAVAQVDDPPREVLGVRFGEATHQVELDVLGGKVVEQAPPLAEQDRHDVQLHLVAGLVDRLQVTIFPVITGRTGTDPVLGGAADFDLELLEHRTLDDDIQELVYRPTLHVSRH